MTHRPPVGLVDGFVFVIVLILSLGAVASVGVVGVTPVVQDASEPTDTAIEIGTCQEIVSPGEYELAGNLSPSSEDSLALDPEEYSDNACIAINASGVTLDGQGYTINGSAFYDEDDNPEHSAVLVQNLSEDAGVTEESELVAPTVTNITVEEWRYGINFWTTSAPTVTDSIVRSDVPSQLGIHVQHSDYGTFERNDVNTAFGVGLAIEESDNATIRDNTIDPSRGVATTGDNTTITENEFTNFSQHAIALGRIDAGTFLQDAGPALNTTIEDNFFDVGTESGSGISGWYKSDSPVIQNNTIYGEASGTIGDGGETGVFLGRYSVGEDPDDGANYSVIRNNTIEGFDNGIRVGEGAISAEIVDNEVNNTGSWGVRLVGDSNDAVVTGNEITESGVRGIVLTSIDNATVYDNVAPENAVGISIGDASNSTVYDNDFSRGGTRDLPVALVSGDVHGSVIEKNNLSAGSGMGVEIRESDGLTLTDNEISNNHNEGIEISAPFSNEVTNLTVEGNTITGNRLTGIVDESSNGTVYADNYLADNEGGTNVKGLLVTDDASNVTIRGNTIANHEDSGIEIDHGGTFEIRNNTVKENKKDSFISFSAGIDVESASSGSIAENEVVDNEFGVRVSVDSADIAVVHNSFDLHPENATEYNVDAPEHVLNATFNSWGADNGPSGGAQDPVTGEYAVGDGDGVDENVTFDPWGGKPATFELSNVLVSSTDLETGEEFFVSTNVTNTGGEFGVDTVRLKYDGDEVTNESVALDPGERTTLTYVADAPNEEGEYNLTVETTDDLFSETINVTEPVPATFELSNFLVSSTDLEPGEEFFVSTNVTNVGEEFGVETVRLKYDGVEVTNESVALDPGERTSLTYVVDAPDEEGEYNLTVETTDGLFSETINVTEPVPATFEITRFDLFTTELEPGEEFLVSANVTNTGEETGLDVARLKLDGQELENETVSLDPGERDTISFANDAPDEPGEYTVSVETQDAYTAAEMTVGSSFEILDADMPVDVNQGDNVTVDFVIDNQGSHGTQQVNFTVYASEQDDDDDDDDDDERINASVAVVDDSRNTTQGGEYVTLLAEEFETVDLLTNATVLDEMAEYDAFVIYRFVTDTLAEDFHEELDDDQGVVYLDDAPRSTTERWADGVFRLHRVYDDPGHWEHVAFDADANPPEVNITVDHPIFDGVGEAGETVILNDNTESRTWGSWFDQYSGDVLAEVDYAASDPEQWGGPGIGMNDDENEVLLPALIHDNLLDHITPEGETLIVNAVAQVAQNVDGTGHTAVTETDDGSDSGNGDDEFPFFGEEVIHIWDELTLDAGETTTRELEYEVPENLAPDLYTQELSTESDAVISELWVELHADIEVSSYSLDPDPAEQDLYVGDTLAAETVLANHGDRLGEFEVEYLINEEVVANETVEVDADSTETVELTHELRESGTKTISVNGVDPVEIDVEGPEADIEVTSYTLDPNPAEDDLFVGDALAVEANLTNHGTAPGEFEVEYIVDEEVVNNETVEVGAATTEIVELEHELRESGTKILSVNGVDPVQITVESGVEPPAFELTDVYPGNHTVGPETVVGVGGNITNTGEEADSSPVELWVDDEMVATDSVTLEPGETSSVSWEIESSNETGEYTLTLSTASESVTHTLTVAVPDPIAGFAQPQDTTGDGLYDDVTGSGNTTIADVQALFDNLNATELQDSAWAFDFAGLGGDEVTIFDVQALFNRIQAEPATH